MVKRRVMALGVLLLAVVAAAGVIGLLDGATSSQTVHAVAAVYQNVQLLWFRWN